MKSTQKILVIWSMLLVCTATACILTQGISEVNVPPSPLPSPAAAATGASAGTPVSGASLFRLSCAACHGQDRSGSTFELDGQTIEVPGLNWDHLNQSFAVDPSRGSVPEQLALAITKGQDPAGGELNAMMPRWSSLSRTQVDSLIQYIQNADPAGGKASLSPEGTSLMGEQLYLTSCAACHGANGVGKTFEKDGNTITTPPLFWKGLSVTFSKDPSRGSVPDQLVQAITRGKDEEGKDLNAMMPRWSFLSRAQVDSLVQYLQTKFK